MRIVIDSNTVDVKTAGDRTCQILAVGDTAFAGLPIVPGQNFQNLFADDVLTILHDKDISCVNVECPLTTVHAPIAKDGPNLSAAPETVDILKQGGFDIAVMANNHIMDHGPRGMWETVEVCQAAGIETVGVGRDLSSAYAGVLRETNGIKTAFLAFAEEEFSCATETTPGAAKLELTAALAVIRKARQTADLVVVNLHGGNEFYPIPSPRMQKWYRFLVDCGAHAVIGHHTHCVQGMEIYNDAPILYSVGNFLFPIGGKIPKCWNKGLIARLGAGADGVSTVELLPCTQTSGDDGIRMEGLGQTETGAFESRFERLSQIAADTELAAEFWKCFCLHRKRHYVNVLKMGGSGLKGCFKDVAKSAVKSIDPAGLTSACSDFVAYLLQRKSLRERNIMRLKNLLSCPAHHEVLSTIVEMEILAIKPSDDVLAEFRELTKECE